MTTCAQKPQRPKKVSLGLFPTPMYRMENISRTLGTNVWIKRDDLCGVALGGNKVRKLEYLLADVVRQGCELIMTTGQAQSNHAMLTAACALRMGLECVLVLKKRGITACRGNQVLNSLMGVEVCYVDSDSYDDIDRVMDRIAAERGKRAYKIPCGGSNALGTLGYVDCMEEIAAAGVPFTHIFTACGSGGTAAGTTLGAGLFMPGAQVTAVAVDNDPFEQIVPEIMKAAACLLGIETELSAPRVINMTGEGYAIPTEAGKEAVSMMLRQEGIVLDTCYTGKAFAGLIAQARSGMFGKDDQVLFLHTGGAGGLFAPDWENETAPLEKAP